MMMEWVSIAEKLWDDMKYNNPRYRAGIASLSFKHRVCFSLGHVFSDVCFIMWSTYLIIYFNQIVGLSPSFAGYLFVVAQCSDALLTPFIEIGVQRIYPNVFPSYGRRKLWHLLGTVLVFLTWPLIFSSCLACNDGSLPSTRLGYYSVLVVMLHLGWSLMRISHLSMTCDVVQRVDEIAEMNAIRSWLSFVCGIFVFSIMWILLGQAYGVNVTPDLQKHFTTLSLIVVGLGFLISFIFQLVTVEPEPNNGRAQREAQGVTTANYRMVSSRDLYVFRRHPESSICLSLQAEYGSSDHTEGDDDQINNHPMRSWRHWFNDPDLYKVGVVYISSRVVTTILQLYIVFYVTESLGFSKEAIAYFPLVLLITELVANTVVTNIQKVIGYKWTFCAASAVVFQSCVWFYLQSHSSRNFVFLSTIMFGGSSSIMMAISLSMVTDLVKKDEGSSGFIYSTMGFFDKIFVGLFVLIIQRNYPESANGIDCIDCGTSARLLVTLTPSVFTSIALVVVIFTFKTNVFVSCKVSDNQGEQWTQTSCDASPHAPQAIDSIYIVNDENCASESQHEDANDKNDSRDKFDDTDYHRLSKGKRCVSAPVLSMRRSFSNPVACSKSNADRLSIPECQTLDGVALAVEKVVVFSFDSFIAGELLSISERTSSLPHISITKDKKENEKPSESIYQQISFLRSTEL